MSNILMVDDNTEVAAVFGEALAKEGHRVRTVQSAYSALIEAMDMPPDLIIMDLALEGGSNGAVAALALRGAGVTCPMIVLTGNLLPIEDRVYAAAGFAGRLLKPTTIAELAAEVQRQIAREAFANAEGV